jgi:anthranilate/para-aminobenzoate synthase component I
MILSRFPEKGQYLRLAESYRVVPVCAQIIADTLTPVSLLGRFYEGKGPIFLLESVEGGERWARYSFLGFSAHLIVRVFADRVDIEEAGPLSAGRRLRPAPVLGRAGRAAQLRDGVLYRDHPAPLAGGQAAGQLHGP